MTRDYPTAIPAEFQPMGLPLYRIRSYRPATDEGYVTVNWMADMARGPMFGSMPYDLACGLVRPHVRRAIEREHSAGHIHVVVPADAPEPIVAFVAVDESDGVPVVWHLHVKGAFRGQGIMADLLAMVGRTAGSPVIAATDTRDLRRIMNKCLYDVHLRPELMLI